jgi:antitoxin VapB
MGLNIKNPRTQQLARELAGLTGETMTAAITEALEQRIEQIRREKKPSLSERWEAITKETAHLWKDPHPTIEELLYDERGLPRGLEE